MDADRIFSICNTSILPFWALLILAPSWKWTQHLVHSALIPTLFGAVYIAAFAMSAPPEGAGFGSLEAVMILFTAPEAVLAGWIHYLTFDLFVGAWEVRDARRQGLPHLAVVPCLGLTFMLGPAGLLLYLVIRGAMLRTGALQELPA